MLELLSIFARGAKLEEASSIISINLTVDLE